MTYIQIIPSGCAPYCSNENDFIGTMDNQQVSISERCCTTNNCNTDQVFNQLITSAPSGVTQSPASSGFKASADLFFTLLFS